MNLKIGHRTFEVRRMSAKERQVSSEELEIACLQGYCDKRGGKIRVWASDIPGCEQADTLLHEVLHAIWFTQELPGKTDEEDAVTKLTHGLCQLIRDNPEFLEVIKAGLDGTPIFKGGRR